MGNRVNFLKYALAFFFILNGIGTISVLALPLLQPNDSLAVHPKVVEFDKSILESYQTNENYTYFKTLENNSAWDKFKNWLNLQWNEFIDWLLSGISEGTIWNYIALISKILLLSGLVVLIIWLFSRYYHIKSQPSASQPSQIHLSEEEELIKQNDLSTLIKEAEEAGNYRLASRYWFLNILKHLKDYHCISYQFQKTNADYQSELKQLDLKSGFTSVSQFYEYVWYGDFTLEETKFLEAKTQFEKLIQTIKNNKTDG